MGLKDSMMKFMMDRMSKEDKLEMMDKMMDNFFSDFTPEEMGQMMMSMMPKMMGKMFEGGDFKDMMGMCESEELETQINEMGDFINHVAEGQDEDFCRQMMGRCMEFMKSMPGDAGEKSPIEG